MYSTIVAGYDLSDRALLAVEEAATLALATNARLHIVTALAKNDLEDFGHGSDRMVMTKEEIARHRLSLLVNKFSQIEVTTSVVDSGPVAALVNEAERIGADLIVVGNRGFQTITRGLNAVASSVAQRASCAVLIANTKA